MNEEVRKEFEDVWKGMLFLVVLVGLLAISTACGILLLHLRIVFG